MPVSISQSIGADARRPRPQGVNGPLLSKLDRA
jgi:hypothetical protein